MSSAYEPVLAEPLPSQNDAFWICQKEYLSVSMQLNPEMYI